MQPAALANRNGAFWKFQSRSPEPSTFPSSDIAFCSQARRDILPTGALQIRAITRRPGDDVADKTKLFTDAAFDQAEVVILLDAYVRACRSLHDRGQPDIVTDVIAERLITLARAGQWDPQKLSEGALGTLSAAR